MCVKTHFVAAHAFRYGEGLWLMARGVNAALIFFKMTALRPRDNGIFERASIAPACANQHILGDLLKSARHVHT